MATLLAILFALRRRHPQQGVELWIIGLVFIFIEAIAHVFYTKSGPQHIPVHIVALDAYLAAGMFFLWAGAKDRCPRRPTLTYLLFTAVPLMVLQTIYAMDIYRPGPYRAVALTGIMLAIVLPFLALRSLRIGKAWWLIPLPLAIWIPSWLFASAGMYRDAAYIALFVVYLSVAIVFYGSLPRQSLGRIAIVTGFSIWAFVFLLHSWVTARPQYNSIAAAIWDWQKFLVAIGMLLVMLERQVASNEWFASHDQLTGLPNRRLFEERLEMAIRNARQSGKRIAVVMIDLNGFKAINDSLGHEVGDILLQQIGDALREAIRPTDTLARLGGDEFIIVSVDLPVEVPSARIVNSNTDRIVDAFKKPFRILDHELMVKASVGVAIYPDDAGDEVLLRRLADQRMYEQKLRMSALIEVEA
ncbi:MAG: diguanylate cyclase [Edaphobacter sp.]|uniref:sensor domain-containing diguanylate cyclase n=1 Tax=Edaphobacter sp. TaxID=1934404 RepID=UPI0023827879|nr:sensor domain-containing diguanylate cyclase [Edaphobacter sp.]MDE1175796.1 diguanylate cyclase [Edaphobacter sp.]